MRVSKVSDRDQNVRGMPVQWLALRKNGNRNLAAIIRGCISQIWPRSGRPRPRTPYIRVGDRV
jgi:hypothetical protein